MIRCFEDPNVVHVAGSVDPVFDKEVIDTELQLKDLESVEKKIIRIEKVAKSGDGKAKKAMQSLLKFKEALKSGKNARAVEADSDDLEALQDIHLLTIKPVLYVANVDEDSIQKGNDHVTKLKEEVGKENAEVVLLCAALEAQIAEFDDVEEKTCFWLSMGWRKVG